MGPCPPAKPKPYPIRVEGALARIWDLLDMSGFTKWPCLEMILNFPVIKKKKEKKKEREYFSNIF
jgi:hypothetical protein